MKNTLLALLCAICVFLISCNKQEQLAIEGLDGKNFLKITKQTIETFDKGETIRSTIEYIYENADDFFWVKEIHKDAKGNIVQSIEVDLDENRLPAVKKVEIKGVLTNILKHCYSDKDMLLLNEAEYQIVDGKEYLVRETSYEYDENGYLIIEKGVRYTKNANYVNVDGGNDRDHYLLHYYPQANARHKGENYLTYFLETRKIYNVAEREDIGKISFQLETKLDKEGNPVYYSTSEPDCSTHPSEQWYKIEKNSSGQVTAIIGYADDALNVLDSTSVKRIFDYDDNGLGIKYEEYKYNEENNKFDKLHSAKYVEWKGPYLPNNFNFVNANIEDMSVCIHRQIINSQEIRITHPEKGKILYNEYYISYKGPYKGEKRKKDLIKTITYEYKTQAMPK